MIVANGQPVRAIIKFIFSSCDDFSMRCKGIKSASIALNAIDYYFVSIAILPHEIVHITC